MRRISERVQRAFRSWLDICSLGRRKVPRPRSPRLLKDPAMSFDPCTVQHIFGPQVHDYTRCSVCTLCLGSPEWRASAQSGESSGWSCPNKKSRLTETQPSLAGSCSLKRPLREGWLWSMLSGSEALASGSQAASLRSGSGMRFGQKQKTSEAGLPQHRTRVFKPSFYEQLGLRP